jgi:hypothetical protein
MSGDFVGNMRKTGLVHLLLWCLISVRLHSATYYVATNGSDTNPGTSVAPWRQISKAASSVIAGDVIRVNAGAYAERVSVVVDGRAGAPITFVADGAVKLLGFNVSADYIRIIGFEITHSTAVGYPGILVSGSNVEILDNYIHHTSGTSIDPRSSHYLIIRGNRMMYSGSPGNNFGSGLKLINDGGEAMHHVVIEYNDMSHGTDFLCSNGTNYIFRNNVLGPSVTSDFGGTPHVDGWQANAQTRYGWMESNWHVDNSVSDSHMILIEAPVSGRNAHFSVTKNVSLRSGDQLWYQMRDGTNLFAAHNTVGQVGYGPRGGPGSSGFFYIWDGSINNVARNNVYTNVTRGSLYAMSNGGQIVHDHDLADVASDITHGVNGNIKGNPQFVNYAANDVRLKQTSPGVDAGGALTKVISPGGTGRSFVVENPDWFHDSFGGMIEQGQKIYVGDDNNLTITAVDYPNRIITISTEITWQVNDSVGFAYRGTGPDLGAYEFGDTWLTAATISFSGGDYVVNTTGDARFVVFYRDGIPYSTAISSPYRATIPSGVVTAKAFALHAQPSPIVTAINASPGSEPTPPTNLRIVE